MFLRVLVFYLITMVFSGGLNALQGDTRPDPDLIQLVQFAPALAVGVMFAPDHQCAAGELVRVCRPGGTIGVISWTAEGYFGRMLAAIRPYRPSLSAALAPSALWGRENYVTGMLGDRVRGVSTVRGMLGVDRFDSAKAVHTYFKNHYGPTIEAYANIGANAVLAAELDAHLIELAQEYLMGGVMEWEYLLLTAEKR